MNPNQGSSRPINSRGFLAELFIGSLSVTISKTATAPVDRVHMIVQTLNADPNAKDKWGLKRAFREVRQKEGFSGFWKGTPLAILRYFPTSVLNLILKDEIREIFGRWDRETDYIKSLIANILAGVVAGSISLLLVYPLDVVRTRLAADIGNIEFSGITDCALKIIKTDGISGLYAGYFASIGGILAYRTVYFAGYDLCKAVMRFIDRRAPPTNQLQPETGSSALGGFIVGFLCTNLAGALSYPFDTVRRVMMMQSGKAVKAYSGYAELVRALIKTKGITCLYGGFSFNTINGAIGTGIVLAYDMLQSLILTNYIRNKQQQQNPFIPPPQTDTDKTD